MRQNNNYKEGKPIIKTNLSEIAESSMEETLKVIGRFLAIQSTKCADMKPNS